MTFFKAKWRTFLTAVCCLFAICCIGGSVGVLAQTEVTASAETTYTVNSLTSTGGSESAINAYPNDGSGKPDGNDDWDSVYVLQSGSGTGMCLNGETLSNGKIKFPHDFYIELGKNAAEGDELTIDGTFSNAGRGITFIFKNCGLRYTNGAWVTFTPATKYTIGSLDLHVNSASGAASTWNYALYLKRTDGQTLPFQKWDNPFTYKSGSGLKFNGESATLKEMQSSPDGLYFKFDAVSANTLVSIGGTFYCANQNIEYTIEESYFKWTGTGWTNASAPVQYTTYKMGKLVYSSASEVGIYLNSADGKAFEKTDDTWTEKWTFLAGSGVGVTYNGTAMAMNDIKIPGNLHLGLEGKTAKKGDMLVIGGTFYNDKLAVKYVIDETVLEYNGTAWAAYVPPVSYQEYTISNLKVANTSMAGGVYVANNVLSLTMSGGAKVSDWPWFVYESGAGFKVNGEKASLTGGVANAVQDTNGGLYFQFAGVKAGDVVSIGGVFSNADLLIRYTIPETQFIWNGTAWATYVPSAKHNIGALALHANSTVGGAKGDNSVLYLQRADGGALPVEIWNHHFVLESGKGLQINGKSATMKDMQSTGDGLYITFNALNAWDKLTIGGTFTCDTQHVTYVIEESSFIWTGSGWIAAQEDYSDLIQGVAYDVVTTRDLGLNLEETISGIEKELKYTPSAKNTTGSMVFRFAYNSSNVASGAFEFRLRGSMWNGIRFLITDGRVTTFNTEKTKSVNLANNVDYVIEFGAIDTADGNRIWTYITVNGSLVASELLAKSDKAIYVDGNPEFGTFTTNCVGIYAPAGVQGTFGDPDHVLVTYITDRGTFEEYADKSSYVVAAGKSYETFIGWWSGARMYVAGEEVDLTESITLTEVSIRFTLEDGAAMRLASTSAESGIRFTSLLNLSDFNALSGYGVTVVEYGTLIMPLDFLGAKQAPNLDDFTEDEDILKIPSTKEEMVDGNVVYRGAMQSLYEGNYDRLFAGRGYITLSINGQTIHAYTPFDTDDNVRSIRFIAQKFMVDTAEYEKISNNKKEVVGKYAAVDTIQLTNYDTYKDYNVLNVMAWYYPELDPSNSYVNATNRKIADDMRKAGIKVVYLDGMYHLDLTSFENIEKTRQIINFFWSEDLYTIAFGSNNAKNMVIDYANNEYPDFSDCEGFIGFLVWDEPQSGSFDSLADFANNFEIFYAGSNATFMVNLLPSYASIFQTEGFLGGLFGGSNTLDKEAYKEYLQNYCDTVLSQVDGEKWLSLDSYPIFANESLGDTFLFDLAMLKYYSLQADATSHIVLQSSGWTEDGHSEKNRMPTEAEMRMQAYAAMAFGIDSMSWWSYSNMRGDNQQNPTDSDEYYNRFANVNNELDSIGHIYKAFEWKGVILGMGSYTWKDDYQAYKTVKGQIGDYELTASDTKHLASVKTNKSKLNYLMGVMEDMNGNEGYVLCNYNNHADSDTQTITLTFDSNVTEVVIYRGGVAQTFTVTNKTIGISLAEGEGVIVLPSKLN